uniref:Kringle domain-containing protein n=1 Tax=Mesocestoides corti TaxID=53468 RepID=A0A5K3FM02_MESCO
IAPPSRDTAPSHINRVLFSGRSYTHQANTRLMPSQTTASRKRNGSNRSSDTEPASTSSRRTWEGCDCVQSQTRRSQPCNRVFPRWYYYGGGACCEVD